jgi:hypothetical protein
MEPTKHPARTQPVPVRAVLRRADHPTAGGGAHQVADRGHTATVGAAVGPPAKQDDGPIRRRRLLPRLDSNQQPFG